MADPAAQALALAQAGRLGEAERICRAHRGRPELGFLLAQILAHHGRPAEAAAELEMVVANAPALVEAAALAGSLYESLGRADRAEAMYRRALSRQPSARLWFNLGNALRRQDRQVEAVECYLQAHILAPADATMLSALVARKQALCDWDGLDGLAGRLLPLAGAGGVQPLRMLAVECAEDVHQRCARAWGAAIPGPARRHAPGTPKDRLTIGYLSADLHRHATAYLAAELFELHDRDRFRVVAYSLGPDDGSEMRRRLEAGFDVFHHLAGRPTEDIAARIAADGVDILVDLKGYTRDARPEILALRPAPIQVSYLGYPGTMGVGFIDYIVADPVVLPMAAQPFYDERIVHLPDCYQVNDRRRPHPARPPRAALGLPEEEGRVLACFNAAYKIAAPVFAVWMDILAATPGAVLWLLGDEPAVEDALRAAAGRAGQDPGRLVFAPRLPLAEHLARYAAADLFLDTLPYNAHTTGSDALWMGCPMVTCRGRSFAARVGASLLHAAGLPQLVTDSLADYRALALSLLGDGPALAGLRRHLSESRATLALFDTPRFTRNLEAAYAAMWARHVAGLPPAAFQV